MQNAILVLRQFSFKISSVTQSELKVKKIEVTFGTADDGLDAIGSINKNTYWRLTTLQSVVGNALESDYALSQCS